MALIQLETPSSAAKRSFALFELGFRPFFLLAGLWSVLGMALWLATLAGSWLDAPYYSPIIWHAHEMLFGFAVAVVTGFLLTAVRNWTGIDTLNGKPLAALALLWLAGRLAPLAGLPPPAIALVDLAFLPAAALAVALPIIKARQAQNLVFGPLLLLLFIANLLVHLDKLGVTQATAMPGLHFA
ncbi:MAG: NnrS family protein, partial [Pseudomonadota bacterium]